MRRLRTSRLAGGKLLLAALALVAAACATAPAPPPPALGMTLAQARAALHVGEIPTPLDDQGGGALTNGKWSRGQGVKATLCQGRTVEIAWQMKSSREVFANAITEMEKGGVPVQVESSVLETPTDECAFNTATRHLEGYDEVVVMQVCKTGGPSVIRRHVAPNPCGLRPKT
jgi:hypothetical protein